MEEKRNCRMDGFEGRILRIESRTVELCKPESAKPPVQTVNTKRAVPLKRQIAAGVMGALLLLFGMLAMPATSSARVSVGVFVNFGPPPLPVYAQPPCPAPGYIWTPGYWAWSPAYGYYWVPGTWVAAPFVGALWTPGYWDFDDGGYRWHPGYWGTVVGFYGGINYGFGYTGYGYVGGYWRHGSFYYNRSVNRLRGREFRHVYYRREHDHFRERRVSYHGGPGGISARPTRAQFEAARHRRFGPVRQQERQARFARENPRQRARVNHGRPEIAATPRPGDFRGHGIVRTTRAGAPYREPARRMNDPRRFERGPSASGPRNAPPQRRMERRGPVRENRGGPARANRQQRGAYRAYSQGPGPRGREGRAAHEWHGSQHQERGHGGNGHGQENGHGRGGRR